MTKANKIKTLAISSALVVAAAGAITVGTYALYTDSVTVTNHFVAGNMDLTLSRTKLEYSELDSEGIQQYKTDSVLKDFSEATSDNMFGFTTTSKPMVPTDFRKATLKLTNSSSVAYDYYAEVKLTSQANKFAEQLKVEVDLDLSNAAVDRTASLKEGVKLGSSAEPFGMVKVGGEANFSIKITFDDLATNNAAQNQEVTFDLVIYAVQHVNKQ